MINRYSIIGLIGVGLLLVGAGEGFLLPAGPRHRGTNTGAEPARLFLIDALPG